MLDWFDAPHPFVDAKGAAPWPSPPSWSGWMGVSRHETPEAVVFTLSVPGYRKRDIAIEVTNRRVVLRGERTRGFLTPRSVSSFVQAFTLADDLDERDVRADLSDGVLSLAVAKKPAARARRIPILVAGETPSAPPPAGEAKSAGDSGSWWRRLDARIRRWLAPRVST